ncbi:hypothetical protein ACFLVX_00855 [Chloroflexota bacterium]
MRARLWHGVATLTIMVALMVALPLLSACGGGQEAAPPGALAPMSIAEGTDFCVVKAVVHAYPTDKAGNMTASVSSTVHG